MYYVAVAEFYEGYAFYLFVLYSMLYCVVRTVKLLGRPGYPHSAPSIYMELENSIPHFFTFVDDVAFRILHLELTGRFSVIHLRFSVLFWL